MPKYRGCLQLAPIELEEVEAVDESTARKLFHSEIEHIADDGTELICNSPLKVTVVE